MDSVDRSFEFSFLPVRSWACLPVFLRTIRTHLDNAAEQSLKVRISLSILEAVIEECLRVSISPTEALDWIEKPYYRHERFSLADPSIPDDGTSSAQQTLLDLLEGLSER